jgi:hypothetical protein
MACFHAGSKGRVSPVLFQYPCARSIADGSNHISFANAPFHLGLIFRAPLEGSGAEVCHEGVRIWIDEQAARLPTDDAFEELAEPIIRARKGKIGPDLRGGVTQPHRRNVAGKDGRIGFSFKLAEGDCRVERVWKAKAHFWRWIAGAGWWQRCRRRQRCCETCDRPGLDASNLG